MENTSEILRFFKALLFSLAGICLYFFVAFTLLSLIYDYSLFNLLSHAANYNDPNSAMLVRFVAMIQTSALFGVPPLIFGFVYRVNPLPFLKLNKSPRKRLTAYTLAIMLVSIPFINFLGEFNRLILESLLGPNNYFKAFEDSAKQVMNLILSDKSISGLLANILVVAFLPALCEELMFRGLIQKGLLHLTKNAHIAIIGAALLFSAAHFQFYGFIPRFILGVLFGYLVLWSNSLWLSILAHFINNATIVLLYFLLPAQTMNNLETLGGDAETLLLGLISGILVSMVLYRVITRYAIQNTIIR